MFFVIFAICYGCGKSTVTTTSPTQGKANTVTINYENTTNLVVYANLGKNDKGRIVRFATLPGQKNQIPVIIPEGRDKVDVPIENEQGDIILTLVVSKTKLRYKWNIKTWACLSWNYSPAYAGIFFVLELIWNL